MSEADHIRLLADAKATQAKVMISGYPSELYDLALTVWRVVDIAVKNHAPGGAEKRTMTERLWMNY
jgi:DNA adenine methylase